MLSLNFEKRDFLYDNGLVNIFSEMERHKEFKKLEDNNLKYKDSEISLNSLNLNFTGYRKDLEEIYFILRSFYYARVFEETKNYKPYYDPEKDKVIIGPKLNVKPFLQRSERTKDLLPRVDVPKSKLEELKKEEEILKLQSDKNVSGKLQYGKQSKVNVYLKPQRLGENISGRIKKLLKGERCILCGFDYSRYIDDSNKEKTFSILSTNLIFDFGTGDTLPSFRDHRNKKDMPICFMCDLIYRYGMMDNYFLNNNLFIISAPSLPLLYKIKNVLLIDSEYKENIKRNIKTNFIEDKDFFTTDIYSTLLLLLYKIKSEILERDELKLLNIFYFTVNSRGVDDLKNYNRMSYIIKFFDELKDLITNNGRPFLYSLINYASYKGMKDSKTKNLPREELSKNILYSLPIDPVLMDLSYNNLSINNPSTLNSQLLFEFFEKYLEVTGMNELKEIHEICMLVGDRIGYFAGETDNKSILYSIREIGNMEGLTEFFKDLEYEIVKEKAGAIWSSKPKGKDETYFSLIKRILQKSQDKKNITLIRNYLAIYAIQKYLSTKYAKTKGGA
ncbi:MAG TPA: hypothetical protein PLO64_00035 [Methanothermobacter sp.]|nr:conserved hypothetical protein [Methanothermobacter sp. MT-2]HHW04538.1 hypothetical protein [Methanothermobacter sp.]HOK72002.1 hypothetical protein [Methanothermobacter sp.]HOL68315.1 hypothetical protein [Methanothermobacter sp.]HPQ04073.1 hypothetical protein [Methanothermobacter sp.]